MSRLSDSDYPDLRTAIPFLLDSDTGESLDWQILCITRLAASH